MKCKCCNREQELRYGFCFDCASAESIIAEGSDMWDKPVEKKEGMSLSMSKVQEILKMYGILTPKNQ